MSSKTPGVYVIEQNTSPSSTVEVSTAIPAFIGYTQRAAFGGKDLTGTPTKVESLQEFEAYFGADFTQTFELVEAPPASATVATLSKLAVAANPLTFSHNKTSHHYLLRPANDALYYFYHSICLFYLNGGGTCYIVSVGPYDEKPSAAKDFLTAIDTLELEPDPTMLLCPDALRLGPDDYYNVLQHMLLHCQNVQSRVALFDVYGGAMTDPKELTVEAQSPIGLFREGVGLNYLNYGIAYFPWVQTSVVSATQVSFINLTDGALTVLMAALSPGTMPEKENLFAQAIALREDTALPAAKELQAKRAAVHHSLLAQYPAYKRTIETVTHYLNTLPVAPAMAGVFTAVDSSRGVWKAPANVSLNAVIAPTVALTDSTQAGLNVDAVSGKSINAIRSFKGQGVLVWGARTLDGNSQDWRYINVRRTMIMIEQSVKLAARAYVFEPNNANTWVTVSSMINTFLLNLWKQGGLAGASPAEAYSVNVGLGSTMTPGDILDGMLRVTVLVAIVRPAEFIVLTFQQQMQKP